jgi:hypothetical protein
MSSGPERISGTGLAAKLHELARTHKRTHQGVADRIVAGVQSERQARQADDGRVHAGNVPADQES